MTVGGGGVKHKQSTKMKVMKIGKEYEKTYVSCLCFLRLLFSLFFFEFNKFQGEIH